MLKLDFHPTGRHFLQIPGPSPVPDRILRAISLPTIDHRGPEFAALGTRVSQGVSSAIAGQGTVADAVAKGQEAAQKVGDKYKK